MTLMARSPAPDGGGADATATDRAPPVAWCRTVVVAVGLLAGCAEGDPTADGAPPAGEQVTSPASPAPVPGAPALPIVGDTETLPWRVWWRYQDQSEPAVVAAEPGGEPLPGTWLKWYFCGSDRSPSGLWRDEPTKGPEFRYVWVTAEVGGVKWRMYTRWHGTGPDPGFTGEQKLLVGHWRHRDDKFETDIELLEGGLARTPYGEHWSWISAGPWLEIQRPHKHGMLVLNCKLSDDLRHYEDRREGAAPDVVGTRRDEPK